MASPVHISSKTWIDRIVDANRKSESPSRYYWWSAAAAIAAAVKKNVVFKDVRDRELWIYPNIYVAIISRDSGGRKGHPINLITRILKEADCTRVVTGRSSFQALISELAKQETLKTGGVISVAQGILISSEFDTMFVKDPDALSTLTDLYGTNEHPEEWVNRLKGSGSEKLKQPCISLLIASNEPMLTTILKSKDREGGFCARTIFVYEEKSTMVNDLTVRDPDTINDERRQQLAEELKEISKVQGTYEFSNSGRNIYRAWYSKHRLTEVHDPSGSFNRLQDQIIKTAMILNLAGKRDMLIHGEELQTAIQMCGACVKSVGAMFQFMNGDLTGARADLAHAQGKVLKLLLRMHPEWIERKKILQRIYPIDTYTLEDVMATLEKNGSVDRRGNTKNPLYRLSDEGLQLYAKQL